MLPQLSALGWFHTLGSLPAVPIGLILMLMHGRIDPATRLVTVRAAAGTSPFRS